MGGNATQNMIPTERRGLSIQATANAVNGTNAANSHVIAFTGAPTAWQGSVGQIGTTHVAPTALSNNWINVVNDAAFGTTFKFNRRGVYRAQIGAQGVVAYAAGTQVGITLDAAAAVLAIATGSPQTTISSSILALWTSLDTVADSSIPVFLSVDVYITDALAGGAQASAAAGASGVGVLRFVGSNNAGAVLDNTILVPASIYATIASYGDLAG